MSPHIAATVIGRPRMEPELSISSVGVQVALIGQRLHRVHHHPRQAPGIEDAFLQIELPGPRLLREQAALQAVGELGDDALQMLKLLIELLAQPRQFVRVAQILGRDFLVEAARIGAIDMLGIRHRALAARLRAAWTVLALGGGGIFLGLVGAVILGGLALHFLGLRAEHGFRFGLRLPLAFLRVVLLAGLLAAILVFVGVVVRLGLGLRLGQIHRGQQLAGGTGEGGLVVEGGAHLQQRLICVLTEHVAPLIEHALDRDGRDLAGHLLARQQRQRRADGQLVLPRHAVVALGLAFLGQLGAEVGGDARHVARANDLDTSLFERVIGILRLAPRRHAGGMQGVVVMTQAQSERIGLAAQFRHLRRRQRPRGQRQAGALAGQAGWAGLERDGAQDARRGALELLGARVVLAAAAHGVLMRSCGRRRSESPR
jgi:hypothetical protein